MVVADADYLPALVFSACLEIWECVDSTRSKLVSSCHSSLTESGCFCLTQATNKGVVAKIMKVSLCYYQSHLPPYFSFFYTKRLSLHSFFLVVMYTIPYSTLNRVRTSHLQKLQKHPTCNTSPSEMSAATMRKQETDTDQPPTSFPASKPTMDRSLSSRYGKPLTFNVVVMFLFYVLSITLCLSSVSTCVCVIFNPVGTFLTLTGYLFYALVLSLLLTFLSIPLIGLYFDSEDSPESQKHTEAGKEKPILKQQREMPAPEEIINAMPVQEEHSADSPTRKLEEPTLTEEAFYKVLAPLVHEAECERPGGASPVEALATLRHRLIAADEFTADLAAYVEGVLIPRLQLDLSSKIGTGIEERIEKPFLETAEDAAGSKEHATRINVDAPTHVETAAPVQHNPTSSTEDLTTRGPRRIEGRMEFSATANVDDADESHSNKAQENVGRDLVNGSRSLSEPRSLDSDFRVALRGYMSYGAKQKRRSRTPSVGSCEESEFQGLVRKTFMLGKKEGRGDKKRARSAGW